MSPSQPKLTGWIILYCILLTLGGLLLVFVGASFMNLGGSEYTLDKVMLVIGFIFFLFGALKFYQLYRLVYIRNDMTIRLVKILLIIDIVILTLSFIGSINGQGETGTLLVILLTSILWLMYFSKSERVKLIYNKIPMIKNNRDY